MKKLIIMLLCAMMLSSFGASAENKNIEVFLNGKTVSFDQQPIIQNDRTFVPVRQIFEMFNMNVSWDGENNTVLANNAETEISLSIGSEEMRINDEYVKIDALPFISGDRTYVPLRAISEALKCNVKWDERNYSVIITGIIFKPSFTPVIRPTIKPISPTVKPTAKPVLPTSKPTSSPTAVPEEPATPVVSPTPVPTSAPTITPTASPTPVPTKAPSTSDERAMEQEVLQLVNQVRTQNGLSSLAWAEDVADVARSHSKDMISRNFFSHTNPDGLSPFDRLKNAGIRYRAAAENIAYGQKNAEAVMNSWMNSSGHRANILNANLKEIGIGVEKNSNGRVYWTQVFVAR